jgi:hypothetical protein
MGEQTKLSVLVFLGLILLAMGGVVTYQESSGGIGPMVQH